MASLNPDAMKLMAAVLADAEHFKEAHKALPALATKLAVDEMKTRPADFELLRFLKRTLGERDFSLLLDAVTKPNLAKAVKSADAHNPELRGAEADWLRKRLIMLVDGEPAFVRPARTAKVVAPKKAAAKTISAKRETNPTKAKNSKATWDGKNRDEET